MMAGGSRLPGGASRDPGSDPSPSAFRHRTTWTAPKARGRLNAADRRRLGAGLSRRSVAPAPGRAPLMLLVRAWVPGAGHGAPRRACMHACNGCSLRNSDGVHPPKQCLWSPIRARGQETESGVRAPAAIGPDARWACRHGTWHAWLPRHNAGAAGATPGYDGALACGGRGGTEWGEPCLHRFFWRLPRALPA